MPETEREVKKEQRRKASRGETQTKDGAFMSHKHREEEAQRERRREEAADSERRRGGDRVGRWQTASAGAARYC